MSNHNDEQKEDVELDLSPEEEEAFSLSSEPPEVINALKALANRRALLQDEPWRSLARGTTTEKELEALQRRTNLSADEQALLDIALPKKDKKTEQTTKPQEQPKGLTRTLPTRRRLAQTAATAMLVAAGFAALWVGKMRPSGPMPSYSLAVTDAEQKFRGINDDKQDTPLIRLPAGSTKKLQIRLSPQKSVAALGALEARAFLARFGTLIPIPIPAVVDPSGEVLVEGSREQLFPGMPASDYELWIAVGHKGYVPSDPEQALEDMRSPGRRLSFSRVRLHFENASPNGETSPLLDVAFTGCTEIVATPGDEPSIPNCQIKTPGKIRLRVKASQGASLVGQFNDDEFNIDLYAASTDKGAVIDVPIPEAKGVLTIKATKGDRRGFFYLPISAVTPNEQLEAARKLRLAGKQAEARALAETLLSDPDIAVQARAQGIVGRIERNDGHYDKAIGALNKAIVLDRRAGRLSGEMSDGLVLSETYVMNRHDMGKGKDALDALASIAASVPDVLAAVPYYAANIAAQTGDIRRALAHYERTVHFAKDLGDSGRENDTKLALSEIFAKLGRFEEARELLAELAGPLDGDKQDADPCFVSSVENQMGWVEYIASLSQKGQKGARTPPAALFERALNRPCYDVFQRANVRTNLALVALENGQMEAAYAQLNAATKELSSPGPYLEDWWKLIISRASNQGSQKEAELRLLAKSTKEPEVRLAALLALAEALDSHGDPAARTAYAEADAEVLRYGEGITFGSGVGSFLATHSQSTERRIEFLLRLAEQKPDEAKGALEEAADAARRSRARALVSVQRMDLIGNLTEKETRDFVDSRTAYERARDELETLADNAVNAERRRTLQREVQRLLHESLAWTTTPRSPQTLSPPGDGELLLVYHPLARGYVGMAITQSGVTAKRLDVSDLSGRTPGEISSFLLEPFRSQIGSAKRIRFAPFGALVARLDFHALPWGDEPLVYALPVSYAVDIGDVRTPEPRSPDATALIATDTARSLSGAENEIAKVTSFLQEHHYNVQKLASASPEEMRTFREALASPNLRLFHFAGHASFSASAAGDGSGLSIFRPDLDGWESGLRMASGALFSAGAVLTLDRVPEFVILSACETGRSVDDEEGAGLGIAQAFVAMGTRAVVATSVEVEDGLAAKIVSGIYQSPSFPDDLAAALRDAQRQKRLGAGWAAYRVLVP